MAKNEKRGVAPAGAFPEVRCKICKKHIGSAEHVAVNLVMCDDCTAKKRQDLLKKK